MIGLALTAIQSLAQSTYTPYAFNVTFVMLPAASYHVFYRSYSH
jgi:hypothetical protein